MQFTKTQVLTIVGAIVVAFVLGALFFGGNNSNTTSDNPVPTNPVNPVPETTTTTVNETLQTSRICYEESTFMANRARVLESQLERTNFVSPTEVRTLISDYREFISQSRDVLSRCGHLAPDNAASINHKLNELEGIIDQLEAIYPNL